MAYAAVISLKLTINALLNSSDPVSFSPSFLQLAYDEATTLQGVLERLGDDNRRSSSSERVTALEGQIRDCAHGLEDVLEFNESVEGEIGSFSEQVKRLEVEFIQELSKQDDDSDDAATELQGFSSNNNIDSGVELLGYSSKVFITIRDHMIAKMRPDDLHFASFLGEVGTGTSLVAKRIFEDRVDCSFDCSAWVRVGAECESKKVLIRILAQVDNLGAGEYEWLQLDDEKVICKQLHKALNHRRYMIVLDTVRNVQLIECLKTSCPDQSNGSLVLFSTGSEEVALLAETRLTFKTPNKLFEENMWFFLRLLCFEDEPISAELEEAGIKIVQNCQGHDISFAKAYLFLDTTEKKSVEEWSKLAADKDNPIFMVQDELSEAFEIKTKIQSIKERDEAKFELLDRSFVRYYDSIEIFKRAVHPQRFFSKMKIISLMGMAGIGKTIFAGKIYRDMSTMRHFDCHVWLTLGPKYQTEEILIDILARMYPNIDRRHMKGDAKLVSQLCEQLSDKRFLIVLDDLWSKEPLHHLKTLFPNIKGTTLVTTRLAKVAIFDGTGDLHYEVRLLNNEESWYLLREKVFAGGVCPPEFEEGGHKIAENCDGLPLLIVTVAEQLLKVEITLEYWNNVAIGKEKSVFMNAHDEISKTLLPSYESLPQHLKACFLYMGVFRNMYVIPTSMLINLLTAEGFLEPTSPQIMEAFIGECLRELVDRSLVLTRRKISHMQIKKCRHHTVFWHLSNSVAAKNKTFYAMNNRVDCSTESIKSQRRLCIRNSVLFGIKDVYNAMEESCLNLRSLLCTGLPHQYPMPLYFGSRLLRVLDAIAIRFYEFPIEVVELIHLKYLGLTCNGRLPSSISQLWKLQHLIVSRYITTENTSLLPIEIWEMKELNHLQVMGGCLPNPKRGDGLLKLSTLLDVSIQSCTKKVLKRIPNVKRLGIRIELNPDDKGKGNRNPFRYLNRISRLRRLESLKCVVVNAQMRSDYVAPPAPISMFPSSLKRLSLSGFGYPWEYMKYIGALENLEELILKSYAFRGPKWDTGFDIQFSNLKFIVLEDTNLECWKAGYFMELRRLSIKHCYKLQELPTSFNVLDKSPFFVEIIDCNPATISWVEEMRQIIPHYTVDISQSWIDK